MLESKIHTVFLPEHKWQLLNLMCSLHGDLLLCITLI